MTDRPCNCSRCYWYDQCDHELPCDDYTPVTDQDIDAMITYLTDQGRLDFRSDWFEYTEDRRD